MDVDSEDSLFTLDGIAAQAWDLIDGSRTLADIEAVLRAKREFPFELQSDLLSLFQNLKTNGLIE